MSNALTLQNDYHTPAAYDAFDYDSPGASPIRGASGRFDDGVFFTGKEKAPIEPGQQYIIVDKATGWQFLAAGCSPQYVMQVPGQPMPEQPHVDESDYVTDLSGNKVHPWRLTSYLYLISIETGQTLTLSGNTAGMRIAVDELTQQIKSMRGMRAGAMPVVELQSVVWPTKWGKKKRPHFAIKGGRDRTVAAEEPPQLEAPEYDDSREYEDVEF